MIAFTAMSLGFQAFFFGAAFIAFLVAFVISVMAKAPNLVALGLALWVVVLAWNALALA